MWENNVMKIVVVALCGLDLAIVLAAYFFRASQAQWPLSPALLLGSVAVLHLLLLPLLLRSTVETQEEAASEETQWPLALATFDARGCIINCSDAFRSLFALGSDSLVLTQFLPPDDRDDVAHLLKQMTQNQARARSEERQFFRADGTSFSGRWHLRPQGQQMSCWVENISPLLEAQQEAFLTRQALGELGEVVAGNGALENRIGALLELGRRRFDVETAFVGQTVENNLRILDVRSADERIRRGQSYDLSQAQNDGKLVRPRGPRGLVHGAFENSRSIKLLAAPETILSAPIIVESEIWATLTFSDAEARPAFHEDDGQFLMLMVGWLGGELERRQSRAQLEAQQLELLKATDALERLATHDGLTDLKNRRALDEQLALEFQRARRYKTPLSMILLDVDKFKSFNDTYGHPAGDEVLKSIGKILGGGVRNIDLAARYGGEEFALLLPNTDDVGALILAERLRSKIESHDWKVRAVTSSFGVATLNAEMKEAAQLLKSADEALYHAKENGRNRVAHCNALQVLAE